MMKKIAINLVLVLIFGLISYAQTASYTQQQVSERLPLNVPPEVGEGVPVLSVMIVVHNKDKAYIATPEQIALFSNTDNIHAGTIFNRSIADMAMGRVKEDSRVKNANYELYSNNVNSPVIMVVNVFLKADDDSEAVAKHSGMVVTGRLKDFPILSESNNHKLTLILNGGAGFYNEIDAFFSHGDLFTQGNPIATNPANKGVRFWGETYLEPGLAGITRVGQSSVYLYGAVSGLFTGRNTSDIYSEGPGAYADFERLYAGILFAGIGKKNKSTLNISYGRQFFQLNDGFLISKYSGSANAGPRSSVYLNSRTTFQKAGLVKFSSKKWSVIGFFLEPEELFKETQKQTNISYAGGYVGYNDNTHFDVGLAYLNRVGGKGVYSTPDGIIEKKGLNVINPKLWIMDIAKTGIFFKSEYAYEFDKSNEMSANGWYVGAGINLKKQSLRPMFYYRYAFMEGDNPDSKKYTRYDPILTGGLGDWVQGINMRKVIGNGNIVSHRLQAKIFPSNRWELSADYFNLRANQMLNVGGLPPITNLTSKKLGDEFTLTSRYFLNNHFMLLGVFSYAIPGAGIKDALPAPVKDWVSCQLALFMFF